MRAVERQNESVISILLKNGAIPSSTAADGRSPLSLAEGNERITSLLQTSSKSWSYYLLKCWGTILNKVLYDR
jgi:hypothetical protein